MPDSDPIVLQWQQEGLPLLLRILDRLDRTLEKVDEGVEDVDKSSKKLGRTQDKLSTQIRKNSRVLTTFGDALSGADRSTGRFVRTSGRMIGAFARVASVGGGAGVAVAGIGLAAAASIGGVVALGSAVLDTARNAGTLADELEPFTSAGLFSGLQGAEEDAWALQSAMEGVGIAFKGAGLKLADEFNPELRRGAVIVTASVLAISDLTDEFGEFVRGVGDFARGFRDGVSAIPGARMTMAAFTGGLSEAIFGLVTLGDTFTSETGPLRNYMDEAEALIGVQNELNRSMRQGGETKDPFAAWDAGAKLATISMQAASDELSGLSQALIANEMAVEAQIANVQTLADKHRDNAAVQAQAEETIAAIQARGWRDRMALIDEENQARINGVQAYADAVDRAFEPLNAYFELQRDTIIGSAQQTFAAVESLAGTFGASLAEQGGRAAVALFRTQQAAGIAQAVISGLVAQARAPADLGPIAGTAYAVANAAQTAATVAAIAAQPPPKVESVNHGGTVPVAPGAGSAPGERVASIQNSEAVINTRGTNQLMRALNNGMMGGGGGAVQAYIGRGSTDRDFNRRGPQSHTSRTLERQRRRASKGNPRY